MCFSLFLSLYGYLLTFNSLLWEFFSPYTEFQRKPIWFYDSVPLGKSSHTRCLDNLLIHQLIGSSDLLFIFFFYSLTEKRKIKTAVLIVKNNLLIWNSNHELDQASISNFKAPGLKIDKGNYSKLYFISDVFIQ